MVGPLLARYLRETKLGREAIVITMFIPMEAGADAEVGGVIYYRFIGDE